MEAVIFKETSEKKCTFSAISDGSYASNNVISYAFLCVLLHFLAISKAIGFQ